MWMEGACGGQGREQGGSMEGNADQEKQNNQQNHTTAESKMRAGLHSAESEPTLLKDTVSESKTPL